MAHNHNPSAQKVQTKESCFHEQLELHSVTLIQFKKKKTMQSEFNLNTEVESQYIYLSIKNVLKNNRLK